jgi:hypothetical protein
MNRVKNCGERDKAVVKAFILDRAGTFWRILWNYVEHSSIAS